MIQKLTESLAPRSQENAVLALFSSVRFGVVLLVLIVVYASIFSALPQVRGAMELTEMEAFRHPLFVTLLVLFYACLGVTTWRRIRWNVTNLGVLTVHAGLFVLGAGALLYFGTKVEGDILLRSPRVELIQLAGPESKVLTSFLAEKGQSWQTQAPMLGGRLKIDVVDARGVELSPVTSASLQVSLGNEPPRSLDVNVGEMKALSDRLALRLTAYAPVNTFYDDEVAALAFRTVNAPLESREFAPIHGLPLHRERYLDEGYTLMDRAGRPAFSKRVSPNVELAGLKIPTGWFERWRMPIAIPTPAAAPFEAQVTGYLPYVGDVRPVARAGAGDFFPGLNYTLEIANQRIDEALFAVDPARSLSDHVNIEFRWVKDAAERDALARPMIAAHELEVETIDPPTRRTLAIAENQVLRIEGTSYELKISELAENWPLMTPGFEQAHSPAALIDVTSPAKSFKRTVIERFPDLSQDIDEKGVRRREGLYDPNIRMRYRSAGKVLIVAGADAGPELIVFDADGGTRRAPLIVGDATPFEIFGVSAKLTVRDMFERASVDSQPLVEPLEARRPGLGRQPSAIRVKLTGRGPNKGWTESRWIAFTSFPEDQPTPAIVRGPDGADWELLYTREPVKLGATLGARALRVNFFPGRHSANTWRSDFLVEQSGGAVADAHVETNVTATIAGWTLFQSGAAQDNWSFTILGVGNRRGIYTMTMGCVLITLGCLYAFYVKPILKKRQAEAALALAASRSHAKSEATLAGAM